MGTRLQGKVALITGASQGMGRTTAILFAQEGARVAIVDLDEAQGAEVAGIITSAGGEALFVRADVSDAGQARAAADATVARFGRLDVLFNNAAVRANGALHEMSEEDWDRVVAVNLRGVFLMSKFAIPYMMKQGGGSIINMSSAVAFVAMERRAAYIATKGAVLALTRAMATDYADHHIRVNALCPGTVATPRLAASLRAPGAEATATYYRQLQVTGTLARPEELAAAALFLASDDSSFMTGAPLNVDGGFIAGRRAWPAQ